MEKFALRSTHVKLTMVVAMKMPHVPTQDPTSAIVFVKLVIQEMASTLVSHLILVNWIMVVVVPELIAFDLDHSRENVSVEGTMLVMDSLALEI